MRIDLSSTGKSRVHLVTLVGTLVCIALAFGVDSYSLDTGTWRLSETWINNLVIPLILAPPFFYYLLSKLRELSLAHRELMTVASTDPLTNCLNRRAFTAMVDAYLGRLEQKGESGGGALLVLDVDHFKAVNDRFGHEVGDGALRIIAEAIRANVRDFDLVARLGGEEFGVFLPGLDPARTSQIAERIRLAVCQTDFAPEGIAHPLSLSIGGVSFVPPTTFSELYRNADQRLYAAKSAGRNRVDITSCGGGRQPRAALM